MIGIYQIGSYVPETCIDSLELCKFFNKEPKFINDKIGFKKLPRKNPEVDTSDMCVAAFESLKLKTKIAHEKIDCILVCTQNPDGCGLPHTAALVHKKLNLPPNVAAFDVSLGCSGYVYSLNLLINFMKGL